MLKYCRKVGNFTQIDLSSMSRETWMEMIPISKNIFDVISLIDFLDAIQPNYVYITFKPRDSKINMMIKHIELDLEHVSFKIKICNLFFGIRFFVKDGIHYIQNAGF